MIAKVDYASASGGGLNYATTTFTGDLSTTNVEVLGKVKFATLFAYYGNSYIQTVQSDDNHWIWQYSSNAPEVHNDGGITQVDSTHVKFAIDTSVNLTWTIYYWYE